MVMRKFLLILLVFLSISARSQTPMHWLIGNKGTSFITTWVIPSNSYTLSIPFASASNNFTIDWGDGSLNAVTTNSTQSHTYTTSGTYSIKINGTCPSINFTSKSELYDIINWGDIGCTSFTCSSSGLTQISAASSSVFFKGCKTLAN